MGRVAWLVALLIIVTPMAAHAQLWSGILSPSRAVTWTTAGVPGGIPNRTTICATLGPGATASQINSAIAACPSGQVVQLQAGTFTLSAGIDFNDKSGVTLRGAGPDQTFIAFTGGTSCGGLGANVCFRNAHLNHVGAPGNIGDWTAGYAKGATSITLSNTTNLKVGTLLILDQDNDSNIDTGTIWVNSVIGVSSNDGPGGGGRPGREQQQLVRVTAISGSTVSISPGLYMPNWRSSQNPGAWWSNDTPITLSGIENMSLNYAGNTSSLSGIYFYNAYNCWAKNVRALTAKRNHVWLYQAAANVVRDSYFYDSQSHASESYGLEFFQSSDNLIENNIMHRITAPFQAAASASGTVVAYNYTFDDLYSVANWMQGSSYHHAAGVNMILHEGNQGTSLTADNVHGPAVFITAFRNQWYGWEPGKTNQTVPVHIYDFNRYFNIVGNVLGTDTYHTNYSSNAPSGTNCNKSSYALGWGGNCGSGSIPNDIFAATSLMRWGNYDVVNAAVRWVATEVPSDLLQFANLLPATQVLPASFYLASKPSWWGTMPWPAVGPGVTNGDIAGVRGFAWRNPAHLCYDNTPKVSGVLTYNANNCYSQGPPSAPPASPVNLSVQ